MEAKGALKSVEVRGGSEGQEGSAGHCLLPLVLQAQRGLGGAPQEAVQLQVDELLRIEQT